MAYVDKGLGGSGDDAWAGGGCVLDQDVLLLVDSVLEEIEDGGHEARRSPFGDAGEREIAAAADDEVHLPAGLGVARDELLGVALALEVHLDGGEVHVAAGGAHDGPAVVGSVDGGERSLELLEVDLFLDDAEDHLAGEGAPGGADLDVAKVVDAGEDERAEDQDGEAAELGGGEALEEGEEGGDAADGVEDEGGVAGFEAASEDHVVDVATISAEDGGVAEVAAADGEGDVDEGKGEGHERSGHADKGSAVLAPDEAEAAEHKADGEAA